MRASEAGLTGSAGQLAVETQFVALGWGVPRNPTEHDLGTDQWVMVRDARRFDVGGLIGVQVKSGPSALKSPDRDDAGTVTGWWFYDSDGRHLKHWGEHNVPHLLVLHDPATNNAYWVHVTPDQVVPTGKGAKIKVPAGHTIDVDHFDQLLAVALGQREPAQWEGSAWEGARTTLPQDQLHTRYLRRG